MKLDEVVFLKDSVLEDSQVLDTKSLDLDNRIGKLLLLAKFVKDKVREEKGNYVSSSEVYQEYIKCTLKEGRVESGSFYKDVELVIICQSKKKDL